MLWYFLNWNSPSVCMQNVYDGIMQQNLSFIKAGFIFLEDTILQWHNLSIFFSIWVSENKN